MNATTIPPFMRAPDGGQGQIHKAHGPHEGRGPAPEFREVRFVARLKAAFREAGGTDLGWRLLDIEAAAERLAEARAGGKAPTPTLREALEDLARDAVEHARDGTLDDLRARWWSAGAGLASAPPP